MLALFRYLYILLFLSKYLALFWYTLFTVAYPSPSFPPYALLCRLTFGSYLKSWLNAFSSMTLLILANNNDAIHLVLTNRAICVTVALHIKFCLVFNTILWDQYYFFKPACKLSPRKFESLAQMTRCKVWLHWGMASKVTNVLVCLGLRTSQEAEHLVQKLRQS